MSDETAGLVILAAAGLMAIMLMVCFAFTFWNRD